MGKRKTKRLLVDRTSVIAIRCCLLVKTKEGRLATLRFQQSVVYLNARWHSYALTALAPLLIFKRKEILVYRLMVLNLNILQSTSLLYHIIA